MPDKRVADGLAHDQAEPGAAGGGDVISRSSLLSWENTGTRDVDDEVTCGDARTVFQGACEVGSRRDPMLCGDHRGSSRSGTWLMKVNRRDEQPARGRPRRTCDSPTTLPTSPSACRPGAGLVDTTARVPEISDVVDQAVSFARPLLRRLFTIARPARVRIRRRKPCTRERRRLLGWNVRLPLVTADSLFRGGLVSRSRCRTPVGLLTAPDLTGKVPATVRFCRANPLPG